METPDVKPVSLSHQTKNKQVAKEISRRKINDAILYS
jgi:hypothetical protein